MNAREALMSLLKKQPAARMLPVKVWSRAMKQQEAIGNPQRPDFPLLQGKEVLLQVIGDKPYYRFVTTAAALARLNNWSRLCFCSK